MLAGFDADARRAVIEAGLVDPVARRWTLVDNDPATVRAAPAVDWPVLRVGGCACCTGALALRTELVRALRTGPGQGFIIEAPATAYPSALVDALRDPALAGRLNVDAVVVAVDLRHAGRWRMPWEGSLGDLMAAQRDCADVVVFCGQAPDEAAARALQAAWSAAPFGGASQVSLDGDRPAASRLRDAIARVQRRGLPWADGRGGQAFESDREDLPGGAHRMRWHVPGAGVGVAWQWPAHRRFSRSALGLACRALASEPAALRRACAAWRTGRQWYALNLSGSSEEWALTHWRMDNRLVCEFDGEPDVPALQALLDAALRDG